MFNATTNANFVNAGSASVFPAVPGMLDLEDEAEAKGYTVFFLTGRPESQHAHRGQPDRRGLRLRLTPTSTSRTTPARGWRAAHPRCTHVQYKSLTRQHIESLGYDIVANLGDQFSDLDGGFADRTFKIPNPMYFLP